MGRRKSGLDRVFSALSAGAIVYGLWYFHVLSFPWALGLGLVFGFLPLVGGLRRSVQELQDRGDRRRELLESRETRELERSESLEKTVLKVAKKRQGVVTPALVVLDTDLKLEEAEKVLGNLASRGYAEMRLKDNGTIDYVFHDLV